MILRTNVFLNLFTILSKAAFPVWFWVQQEAIVPDNSELLFALEVNELLAERFGIFFHVHTEALDDDGPNIIGG